MPIVLPASGRPAALSWAPAPAGALVADPADAGWLEAGPAGWLAAGEDRVVAAAALALPFGWACAVAVPVPQAAANMTTASGAPRRQLIRTVIHRSRLARRTVR